MLLGVYLLVMRRQDRRAAAADPVPASFRSLREQGLVSGSEAKKNRRAAEGAAWRGHHYFSLISSLLG